MKKELSIIISKGIKTITNVKKSANIAAKSSIAEYSTDRLNL